MGAPTSSVVRALLNPGVPNPLNLLTRTTWTDQPRRVARVFVADGRLRVFVSANGSRRATDIAVLEDVEDVTVLREGRRYTVTRPDGSSFVAEKQGCGCGTPLKNFDPRRWP